MRRAVPLVLCLLTVLAAPSARAQICTGDVTLASQAEVDAFNCGEVTGKLVINGQDITDLGPLSVLTSVRGHLFVVNNDALPSLEGLENLASVGDLSVRNNAALPSLSGLGGIISVGRLIVRSNRALVSLSGLESLTRVRGHLFVGNNDALPSLSGLEGIRSVGRLTVDNNEGLSSLVGLEGLTSVGGYLSVSNNPALSSLVGLESLTTVGVDLRIEYNNALSSLVGLESLTSIGVDLRIEYNPALSSLEGLESLTSVGVDLRIEYNNALSSLVGLESLTSVSGELMVDNNDALSSLVGLESLTSVGNVSVYSNAVLSSLSGLEGLTSVGNSTSVGNVSVSYNPALSSLSGLDSLTLVRGALSVSSNAALSSLSGLESLAIVYFSVEIAYNRVLPSLAGLESLFFLGRSLEINNNPAMSSLMGVESLTQVRGALDISDNDALSRCSCGLSGLISGTPPAFSGVVGSVIITRNAPDGTCTSPAVVLANPCATPPDFDLVAIATSDTTVAPGGAVSFAYTIANNTAADSSGALWFTVSPGEQRRVIQAGEVPGGETFAGSYTQHVPAVQAPGIYTYTLHIGQYPDEVADSVAFAIIVTGAARTSEASEGPWTVSDVSPWAPSGAGSLPLPTAAATALPKVFALHPAAPNPFGSSTTLRFDVPEVSDVTVEVLDVLGRRMVVLVDGRVEAGAHAVRFDARVLPSGTYFVRLRAGGIAQTQRLTRLH